jgi:hypothetical protein
LENNATLKLSINDANLKVEAANREKKAAEDAKGKLVKQLNAAAIEVKKVKVLLRRPERVQLRSPRRRPIKWNLRLI